MASSSYIIKLPKSIIVDLVKFLFQVHLRIQWQKYVFVINANVELTVEKLLLVKGPKNLLCNVI